MLADRDANGAQVANPAKFPLGFKAVADEIHALGLKSGLYTAKGPNTCAKFAASCGHEVQDAAQWASWGIDVRRARARARRSAPRTRARAAQRSDAAAHPPPPPTPPPQYVKDDSCSVCVRANGTAFTDDEIYHEMWLAIEASGRPMVLTVEGRPTDALITLGGYGNAKRVGHDISPVWTSMTSLVDVGSGLWMYAHNSTNATFGGWWNDRAARAPAAWSALGPRPGP